MADAGLFGLASLGDEHAIELETDPACGALVDDGRYRRPGPSFLRGHVLRGPHGPNRGQALQFLFRNPHSFVHVEAPDEKGEMHRWAVEWGGAGSSPVRASRIRRCGSATSFRSPATRAAIRMTTESGCNTCGAIRMASTGAASRAKRSNRPQRASNSPRRFAAADARGRSRLRTDQPRRRVGRQIPRRSGRSRSGRRARRLHGVPINDAARRYADAFDVTRVYAARAPVPAVHLAAHLSRSATVPDLGRERSGDAGDHRLSSSIIGTYQQWRTIWMDGRPHPPEYAPHTFMGFSTGDGTATS